MDFSRFCFRLPRGSKEAIRVQAAGSPGEIPELSGSLFPKYGLQPGAP